MSDERGEELLEAVARLAREEAEDDLADPRWDAMAEGDATDAEGAASSGQEQEAERVFQPFDQATTDRFVQAALAQVAPKVVPVASLPEARARLRKPLFGALALIAAAALVALFLAQPAPVTYASLPAFELALRGGDKAVRGVDADETMTLTAGARVTATLRPSTPVEGPTEVTVFLVIGERRLKLDAAVEISADGAVKAVVTIPHDASPALAELVVLLGRPGELPPLGDDASGLPSAGDRLVVFRRPVRIREAL